MPFDNRESFVRNRLNYEFYSVFNSKQDVSRVNANISELIDFINHTRKELNSTAKSVISNNYIISATEEKLKTLALDIRMYRYAIGMALSEELFKTNYLQFLSEQIKSDSVYFKVLKSDNPFLLFIHIIKLYNIANLINKMLKGEIAADQRLISNKAVTIKLLNAVKVKVEKLNQEDYGIFKLFLIAFIDYSLGIAHFTYLGEADQTEEYRAEQRTTSRYFLANSYACALAIHSLEALPAQQEIVDFFTIGRGLYSRISLSSTEEFVGLIESFRVLTVEDIEASHVRKDAFMAKKQA